MNLALDIGNTHIKYALFQGRDLLESGRLELPSGKGETPASAKWEELCKQPIERLVYSSVRKHFAWEGGGDLPKGAKKNLHLQADTPLPIKNRYHTPETLGTDRLAAAVGAYAYFGGENCILIDAGSCITLDLLLDGAFEGGNISPGLDMRLDAMHRFTDGLPRPAKKLPAEKLLGKTTEEALLLGALQGAVFEIEGFIASCEQRYGAVKIALTGGDASFLADKLKREIFVLPNLVLRGLNEILLYNV